MSEQGPEHQGEELSTQAVIEAMQNLAAEGRIDFTDEDIEHISVMETDEAIAYLMFALAEAGEDPDAALVEFNLIEEENQED